MPDPIPDPIPDPGPIRVVVDPGGPEGPRCTVTLPAEVAPRSPEGEVACRFRIALSGERAGAAADLLVAANGGVVKHAVLLSGVEQEIEIVLPAAPATRHTLTFRLVPDGAPASLHLRAAGAVLRRRDRRARDAVIAAGHAAALALFPAAIVEGLWSNAPDLADLLAEAVRAGAPFSMVRLGDGEGRLLADPVLLRPREIEDATITYMFGHAATTRLRERHGPAGPGLGIRTLRHLVLQAMENADAIGLPGPEHFRRYFAMAEGPDKETLTGGMLGFAGALFACAQHLRLPAERLFDTYIFHGMHEAKLYDRVLGGLGFLGLAAHTDRRHEIAQRFGIATVEHVRVPAHQTFMPSDAMHFPDGFEAIVDALRPPFPGAPYLVAAGYLGKAYCDVIKARGGVAIDIGSVFDGWFGAGNPIGARNTRLRLMPA